MERYPNSFAKKTRGCNTKARTAVLNMIWDKIKASKESGRYEQDVTIIDGLEYIHISLLEIVKVVGYDKTKYPKQYARNLLKHILNNGVLKEYDTGEKERQSPYTKKKYAIADLNIMHELREGKEKLTQKYLYPTRCRHALEATEYFIAEARRNGVCQQEIRSPRFFKRIGRILKDFFFNDLEKFKAWVRYIYDHGKKGAFILLRNDAEVLRIFVLKTFKKIYAKYERSFKLSGYWWENNEEERASEVIGRGETQTDYQPNYHFKYTYKGGEDKKEEEKPAEEIAIEYPDGATEEMRPAFREIHRLLGAKDYKTYVLDSLIIDGDTVVTTNNDFHWKVSATLDLYGINYRFVNDTGDDALKYYLNLA